MTTRPPAHSSRLSFAARVRRWLRRAWLDSLPVAGWLSAWREDRRRRQAAARKPRVPRLLPDFDPFEDRSFLGPNFTVVVQVGLVALAACVLPTATAKVDHPLVPATPDAAPPTAGTARSSPPIGAATAAHEGEANAVTGAAVLAWLDAARRRRTSPTARWPG